MIEIPDSLRSLFTGTIERRDGKYVIEVPVTEVERDALSAGETYRVALVKTATETDTRSDAEPERTASGPARERAPPGPPVEKGEVRDVTIETVGDQGDGIAKVERGYVVIVDGARPGDEPTVEIEQVKENVAFASVIENRRKTA